MLGGFWTLFTVKSKDEPAVVGLVEYVKIAVTIDPLFEHETEESNVPTVHDIEDGRVTSAGKVKTN